MISWGLNGPGGFNDQVLKDFILKNPLIDQIKFCLLYESNGRLNKTDQGKFNLSDSSNRVQLLEDFNYFESNCSSHPSYLKTGGKQEVFFDTSRYYVGDVSGALEEIRNKANVSGYGLYLVCDALGNFLPPTDPKMVGLFEAFDASSADDMWVNNYDDPEAKVDFANYTRNTLALWEGQAEAYGKDVIRSITPGWEPYVYYSLIPGFNAPFLMRNTTRYDQLLSIGFEWGHLYVGHFNEFFVYSHVEPDTKDDFAYLNLIQKHVIERLCFVSVEPTASSPIKVCFTDQEGRKAGFFNCSIVTEIPGSSYDVTNGTIKIPPPPRTTVTI